MQYYTKNFYVGELDWTYSVRLARFPPFPISADGLLGLQKGGDSPSSFYAILEAMPYSGSMIWSVFGHGKLNVPEASQSPS